MPELTFMSNKVMALLHCRSAWLALDMDCCPKAGNASNIGLHQSTHFATNNDQFKEVCNVADCTCSKPPKCQWPCHRSGQGAVASTLVNATTITPAKSVVAPTPPSRASIDDAIIYS